MELFDGMVRDRSCLNKPGFIDNGLATRLMKMLNPNKHLVPTTLV